MYSDKEIEEIIYLIKNDKNIDKYSEFKNVYSILSYILKRINLKEGSFDNKILETMYILINKIVMPDLLNNEEIRRL